MLVHLEHLDAHKNSIAALPAGIGSMRALQKLDLSENKLTELPVALCDLSDELQDSKLMSIGEWLSLLEHVGLVETGQVTHFGAKSASAGPDPPTVSPPRSADLFG